jgi:hypothetical protein
MFLVVTNWGVVLGLISILVLIIVILSISLPGLIKYSDDETQKNLLEEIDDSQRFMCGMPDQLGGIFDSVGMISSEKFDNRAKGIYQQMQWGNDIESCDVVYFYGQLDFKQKERLNWLEFSCNIPQCLSD